MAAVTENKLITGKRFEDSRVSYPAADERLYQGTLAFLDASTGYLTGDDNAGANKLAGIVIEECDNSAGSAGDLSCEVYTRGEFELVGSSFNQASVGDKIYAVDNYTTQASATSATLVGNATEYISATKLTIDIAAGVLA
jgi:predicted RecA/RadA family phage recombinase